MPIADSSRYLGRVINNAYKRYGENYRQNVNLSDSQINRFLNVEPGSHGRLGLPRWQPTEPEPKPGPGGRASRSSINRTASSPRERTLAVAALGTTAPLIYGEDRVGPHWFAAGKDGSDLILAAYWCVGPIDSIVSIEQESGDAYPAGVTLTHYTGQPGQTQDSALQAIGVNKTLVSTWQGETVALAYTVFRIPRGTEDALRPVAKIRGFNNITDPRDSSTGWTDNPALILRHFAESSIHGPGWTLDNTSVGDVADVCDAVVTGGSKRRTLNLAMDRRQPVSAWLEALRTYAGCFLVRDGDTRKLVPDRPTTTSRSIDGDQLYGLRLRRRRAEDAPTLVRVHFTDRATTPWTEQYAEVAASGVDTGATEARVSDVRLPGYTSYEEAYREAVERLNAATLVDLEGTARTTDESLVDLPGDVIEITDDLGLTAKQVRVLSVRQPDVGVWEMEFSEYDSSVYSDDVQTGPSSSDTTLPSPSDVPDVSGFSVSEEVFQLQNGNYSSRFEATWDEADYPYPHYYQWQIRDDADAVVWRADTHDEAIESPAIKEGVTYTIRVRVVSDLGFASNWVEETLVAQGKGLVPGDVPQLTLTRIGADAILAEWLPAIDIDLRGYDLRRGSGAFADATVVDEPDTHSREIRGLSLGSHTIQIKAIDSIRQRSANATTKSITLTAPVSPASVSGFEVGGEVRLNWPAASGFIKAYEIRYYASGESWADGIVLDRIDSLRLVSNDPPAGTWTFQVRSVDEAGNMATSGPTVEVEVTLDSDAFFVGRNEFDSPTTTNMYSWTNRPDPGKTHYLSDDGTSWDSLFPNNLDTYTDPLWSYLNPGGATTEWLSETWDAGTQVSGTWRATAPVTVYAGSVTTQLEVSTDDTNWDVYPSLSAKVTARYARVRYTTTGVMQVTLPGPTVRIDAVPREENNSGTSASSGPTTITLDNEYTSVLGISISPESTAARNAAHDNIVVGDGVTNSYDVYIFDKDGAQVATDFLTTFKGV